MTWKHTRVCINKKQIKTRKLKKQIKTRKQIKTKKQIKTRKQIKTKKQIKTFFYLFYQMEFIDSNNILDVVHIDDSLLF